MIGRVRLTHKPRNPSSKKKPIGPCVGIDWIEAANYCVRLHLAVRTFLARTSLTRPEGLLDPREFARVHRSPIVRMKRVREVRSLPNGDYVLLLENGTPIRMSRSRRRRYSAPWV